MKDVDDNDNDNKLESDGERFLPEWGGQSELEHRHRYLSACSLAKDKVVLDVACGEGYGSDMLSFFAEQVIGIDISSKAVRHASNKYKRNNLDYLVGNCTEVPLLDNSVDLVVSFETIEHHNEHKEMMEEIQRVLRKDGILIMSSPDKKNYSEIPGIINPYHIKELYENEFKKLLSLYFSNARYFGQKFIFGSLIYSESKSDTLFSYKIDGDAFEKSAGIKDPTFWIVLASNAGLPELSNTIVESAASELDQIKRVVVERDEYNEHLVKSMESREKEIASLKQVVGERDDHNAHLIKSMGSREKEIASLKQVVGERDEYNEHLVKSMESREKEIASLKQVVGERDEHNEHLLKSMELREKEISSLKQVVGERDEHNEHLLKSMELREKEIASLKQVVGERDEYNEHLLKSMELREEEIASLKQVVGERDEYNANLVKSMELMKEEADILDQKLRLLRSSKVYRLVKIFGGLKED